MSDGDSTLRFYLQPIQWALDHPQVTDIVINRPGRVCVRQGGAWIWHDVPAFDFPRLDALSILIGQRTGREFDAAHPYVTSTLPGGQRFQGVRPPGTRAGCVLWAIRRPPAIARRIDDPDFADLTRETNQGRTRWQRASSEVASAYRNRDWRRFFEGARLAGLSIGFVGATGGGKTDMARRMIQVSRPNVRMVTIETDDEFGDAGPENKAPLLYGDTQITPDEAVRIALRLIPEEIFLQEVRGAEAYALFRAMESGHSGCTSWHGREGRELEALAIMVRQHPSARDLAESRLMEMLRSAIDVIAYCERGDDNRFRISSVRLLSEETP